MQSAKTSVMTMGVQIRLVMISRCGGQWLSGLKRIFWDRDFEWQDEVIRARARNILGAAIRDEYACNVPPSNDIPVNSIVRGFDTMRRQFDREWKSRGRPSDAAQDTDALDG